MEAVDFNRLFYFHQYLFRPTEMFLNILVPVICGLIIFQYLQGERGSTFFHSLPIKREKLYFQNLLSGFVLLGLPLFVNALLTYGVFASFGITEGYWLQPFTTDFGMVTQYGPVVTPLFPVFSYWFFRSLLMVSLFYVFTVFVGMFTGNILLQGLLTGIGMVLPLGVLLRT